MKDVINAKENIPKLCLFLFNKLCFVSDVLIGVDMKKKELLHKLYEVINDEESIYHIAESLHSSYHYDLIESNHFRKMYEEQNDYKGIKSTKEWYKKGQRKKYLFEIFDKLHTELEKHNENQTKKSN